jgi:hypothetical protein
MPQTILLNQSVYDAIAQQIVDDLYNHVRNQHPDNHNDAHKYHEDLIFEREIDCENGDGERYYFEGIWQHSIINSEIADIFDTLQPYGQKSIKDYVRDVYPDWRESMN